MADFVESVFFEEAFLHSTEELVQGLFCCDSADTYFIATNAGQVEVFSAGQTRNISHFSTHDNTVTAMVYLNSCDSVVCLEKSKRGETVQLVCYSGWSCFQSLLRKCLALPFTQTSPLALAACPKTERIALLNSNNHSISVWLCPSNRNQDFEHVLEMTVSGLSSMHAKQFFICGEVIGYCSQSAFYVVHIDLIPCNNPLSSNLKQSDGSLYQCQTRLQERKSIYNTSRESMTNWGNVFNGHAEIQADCNSQTGISLERGLDSSEMPSPYEKTDTCSYRVLANVASWKWGAYGCSLLKCHSFLNDFPAYSSSNNKSLWKLHTQARLTGVSCLCVLPVENEPRSFFIACSLHFGRLYSIDRKERENNGLRKKCTTTITLLGCYTFSAPLFDVALEPPFLFILTQNGLEIWTAPLAFSTCASTSAAPTLIAIHSECFWGRSLTEKMHLCVLHRHLVLLNISCSRRQSASCSFLKKCYHPNAIALPAKDGDAPISASSMYGREDLPRRFILLLKLHFTDQALRRTIEYQHNNNRCLTNEVYASAACVFRIANGWKSDVIPRSLTRYFSGRCRNRLKYVRMSLKRKQFMRSLNQRSVDASLNYDVDQLDNSLIEVLAQSDVHILTVLKMIGVLNDLNANSDIIRMNMAVKYLQYVWLFDRTSQICQFFEFCFHPSGFNLIVDLIALSGTNQSLYLFQFYIVFCSDERNNTKFPWNEITCDTLLSKFSDKGTSSLLQMGLLCRKVGHVTEEQIAADVRCNQTHGFVVNFLNSRDRFEIPSLMVYKASRAEWKITLLCKIIFVQNHVELFLFLRLHLSDFTLQQAAGLVNGLKRFYISAQGNFNKIQTIVEVCKCCIDHFRCQRAALAFSLCISELYIYRAEFEISQHDMFPRCDYLYYWKRANIPSWAKILLDRMKSINRNSHEAITFFFSESSKFIDYKRLRLFQYTLLPNRNIISFLLKLNVILNCGDGNGLYTCLLESRVLLGNESCALLLYHSMYEFLSKPDLAPANFFQRRHALGRLRDTFVVQVCNKYLFDTREKSSSPLYFNSLSNYLDRIKMFCRAKASVEIGLETISELNSHSS
jgi:hypothetical protein